MATGIVALVTAISNAVVAGLAAASYPALTDGKILLGRQHDFEESAPPRIIFVPTGSTFGPKSVAGPSNVAANAPYSAETLAQTRQRSILTEFVRFEVSCWGQSSNGDPDADFDTTWALYHQVLISAHLIAAGVFNAESLKWTDAEIGNTQHVRAGRHAVFGLTIATPVLDALLQLAPSNTTTVPTNRLTSADGSITETGCSG